MKSEKLISLEKLCCGYEIEQTFFDSLNDAGLIQIVTVGQARYVESESIAEIEKMMRLHFDLGINMEGIDVISQLLKRMDELQREVTLLKNKFEND